MPKRLVLSPELLLLAPLPDQRRGVSQALRAICMAHGDMPVVVSCDTTQGELRVDTGPRTPVLDRIQFQIQDWHNTASVA